MLMEIELFSGQSSGADFCAFGRYKVMEMQVLNPNKKSCESHGPSQTRHVISEVT